MAWTTPQTFVADQLVDEDDMNEIQDNLNYLYNGHTNWTSAGTAGGTASVTATSATSIGYPGTITAIGRPVIAHFQATMEPVGGGTSLYMQMYAGGSAVGHLYEMKWDGTDTLRAPISFMYMEVPSAGSRAYDLRAYLSGSGGTAKLISPQLHVYEV